MNEDKTKWQDLCVATFHSYEEALTAAKGEHPRRKIMEQSTLMAFARYGSRNPDIQAVGVLTIDRIYVTHNLVGAHIARPEFSLSIESSCALGPA